MSADLLPSWIDGTAKRAIVTFLTESTTEGSPRFIEPADRIAAFDNDGTLWVEKPAPAQTGLILGKLVEQVKANPALAAEDPYKAIVNKDEGFLRALAQQDEEAVLSFLEGIGEAWEGVTPDAYAAEVKAFLASNVHERFGRPFTDLVYQPMLELFDFLKANDFRVYVCSGGGRDFMRVISEDVWGLLREYVIGSAPEFEYKDGQLTRAARLRGSVSLGPGKPEQIFARTGRRARFACGNGDVDIEMLDTADFALVVVHDDGEREYDYTDAGEKLLARADDRGWTRVSVKEDWKTVFRWDG